MSDRSVREAINQITGNDLADRVHILDAEVITVDQSKRTAVCRAIDGKAAFTIPDVRLMAAVDDGMLIIPTVGSTVCIVMSDFTSPYISKYSGVDKIILMGGDLGGLVKLLDLVTRLNLIEQDINNLKNVFGWTPVPNDGGAALKLAAASWAAASLTKTKSSDIENVNITQG